MWSKLRQSVRLNIKRHGGIWSDTGSVTYKVTRVVHLGANTTLVSKVSAVSRQGSVSDADGRCELEHTPVQSRWGPRRTPHGAERKTAFRECSGVHLVSFAFFWEAHVTICRPPSLCATVNRQVEDGRCDLPDCINESPLDDLSAVERYYIP